MKIKFLPIHVLSHPHLAVCTTETMFVKYFRDKKFDKPYPEWIGADADGTTHSITADGFHPTCIVCMRPRTDKSMSSSCALLAHEARHVYETMTATNPGIMWEGEELAAVCIQVITQRLTEEWLRQIGRKDCVSARVKKEEKR